MKKRVIKIAAIALAVIIAAGGITAGVLLPHPLSYDIDSIPSVGSKLEIVSSEEDEVTVKCGDTLKVLMFTDLHLDGKNKTSKMTVDNMVKNIVREKPDLVILGGDNVTSALNRKRANQFAGIFEKLGVYWAGVLGNHEGDSKMSVSRDEMVEIFSSYDHCLMKKGPEDIFGSCNYALTVLDPDDTVKQTFFFLDTGDEMSAELKEQYGIAAEEEPYDGAKEDQVKWYYAKNNALKAKYGSFTSTLVVHIPLPQYELALGEGSEMIYGEKLENVCESGFDSGLFKAILECGTTKHVFCGHDHLNNFAVNYQGVVLSYIQPSGYGSYTSASKLGYEEKDWLQGCTVLTFGEGSSFETAFMRNSEVNK